MADISKMIKTAATYKKGAAMVKKMGGVKAVKKALAKKVPKAK